MRRGGDGWTGYAAWISCGWGGMARCILVKCEDVWALFFWESRAFGTGAGVYWFGIHGEYVPNCVRWRYCRQYLSSWYFSALVFIPSFLYYTTPFPVRCSAAVTPPFRFHFFAQGFLCYGRPAPLWTDGGTDGLASALWRGGA